MKGECLACELFDKTSFENTLREIGGDKAKISSLTPCVFDAYMEGDEVAHRILEEEAEELVICVAAVHNELFNENDRDVEVVAGGYNLIESDVYFDLFSKAARKRLPGINVIKPRKEPTHGAIIYLQYKYGLLDNTK